MRSRNWFVTVARTVVRDSRSNPEQAAIQNQNEDIARRVLESVSPRDREILIRFYLEEQAAEQICDEMDLTETQFRLLKSRAKDRFGELAKRKVTKRLTLFSFGEHWRPSKAK
jgi:RNA polymerase sigma-70 factor (ECF subfamily)